MAERPPTETFEIPGMTLLEVIGRGSHSVVHRATREGRTYAVKVQRVRASDGTDEAALRFRREASILACLRHPGLPAILELGEAEGRPYIVQEFVGGHTLSQLVADGPLPETTIVAIAKRLAGALAEVHKRGMVHCDVKPDNILVDDSGGARLVDFGFAVRASGSYQRERVVGTLLYSAPEQTGMLKRPIDGRSDLYALGVVLYECATGTPPFTSEEAGELVRQHAAVVPEGARISNPAISPALSAVIDKLLAKDPDDRYQSRRGLVGDLDRLDELTDQIRAGQQPDLGAFDRPARILVELPLVGREGELERLLSAWERIRTGGGGAALLVGEPGMGRSRIAGELVRRVQEKGEVALLGRCSDESPLPFAPFREAMDDALKRLGRLRGNERQEAEAALRRAASPSAALLKRFSPSLDAFLEDAPEMPGLDEIRDQFYDSVAQLFLRYAKESRRALLVLEDVEWMDDASRLVLARMAIHLRDSPVMVLLTASSEEGAAAAVEAIAEDLGTALTTRVVLRPLRDKDLTRLVAEQLGDAQAEVGFARRIAARSKGSPLAATEYVRAMLDAGLLRPSWGQWLIDEAGLDDVDLPIDIVELAVRRIDALGPEAREVLCACAVVGAPFEPELIVRLVELPDDVVREAVAEGVREGLLERRTTGGHAFVHRAVRAALIDAVSADQVQDLHQRIAEALDAEEDQDAATLYARALHYSRGHVDSNPDKVIEVNVAAGQKALAEYAHEQAYAFLEEAERCALDAEAPLPHVFPEAFGEVCVRTGRIAEAIEHFEKTLERSEDRIERAQIRSRLAHTHIANFHTKPAWLEAQAGFAELGAPFPRWRLLQLLTLIGAWLSAFVAERLGLGFGTARGTRREWYTVYAQLCENAAIQAYFSSRPFLLIQLVTRHLLAATRLGPSAELVASYCQQAVVYSVLGLRRVASSYIAKAVGLSKDLGDRLTLARCHVYHAFVIHLCGDSVRAERIARRALEDHSEWLDALHFLDGSGDLVYNLMLRGYFREAWVWADRQLARLRFTSGGVVSRQGNPWAGPALAALGRTSEAAECQRVTEEFVEGAPKDEPYMWGEMLAWRILYKLEQGETGEAVERAIAAHRKLGLRPETTNFHQRSFYLFQALARMEQAMMADAEDLDEAAARLRGALGELRRATLIPSFEAHAQVIRGALHRLEGRIGRAEACLDKAARLARKVDSPWVHYEVARQRAHLLVSRGQRASAEREARAALALAHEHGWRFRARKIREEFGLGGTSRLGTSPLSYRRTPVSVTTSRARSHAGSLQLQRQLDALLQVSAATATVLDPDRQTRIALDEVVRILGAERAFFFGTRKSGARLEFLAGRNARCEDLDQPRGFSSTVVETVRQKNEPVIVSGTDEGAVIGSESVVAHDLRSIVAAPVRVRDQSVGVLYLDSRLARGVFTEDDVQILLAIGSHIAVALETSRAAQIEIQFESERQRRHLAEGLRDMSHALSSTLNLDEVLERLLQGVSQVLPQDGASVLLLEKGNLRRAASVGNQGGTEALDTGIPLHRDPVLADVIDRRQPVIIQDVEAAERRSDYACAAASRSWMGVPLISHDQAAGILTLESTELDAYGTDEAEIAFAFAGQAGIAIENARLFGEVKRLAITDELTGTLNRRHFFALAEREFSRARRQGVVLSAIMLDVDRFKRVNDEHGHAVGDQVLREIGARCRRLIRKVDILGRYGGEEFAFVLPDTDLEAAAGSVAERIRSVVADIPVRTRHGEITTTVSLGVAQATSDISDLGALLDRADKAMYTAKAKGRNRVEVFTEVTVEDVIENGGG